MKTLVLASGMVIATVGSTLAQCTTAPAGTPPETTAPAAKEPAAAVEREATQPTTRPGDPNSTGPDKVNGMEVPAMKGESGTGR